MPQGRDVNASARPVGSVEEPVQERSGSEVEAPERRARPRRHKPGCRPEIGRQRRRNRQTDEHSGDRNQGGASARPALSSTSAPGEAPGALPPGAPRNSASVPGPVARAPRRRSTPTATPRARHQRPQPTGARTERSQSPTHHEQRPRENGNTTQPRAPGSPAPGPGTKQGHQQDSPPARGPERTRGRSMFECGRGAATTTNRGEAARRRRSRRAKHLPNLRSGLVRGASLRPTPRRRRFAVRPASSTDESQAPAAGAFAGSGTMGTVRGIDGLQARPLELLPRLEDHRPAHRRDQLMYARQGDRLLHPALPAISGALPPPPTAASGATGVPGRAVSASHRRRPRGGSEPPPTKARAHPGSPETAPRRPPTRPDAEPTRPHPARRASPARGWDRASSGAPATAAHRHPSGDRTADAEGRPRRAAWAGVPAARGPALPGMAAAHSHAWTSAGTTS
jgi:hypothetical protein